MKFFLIALDQSLPALFRNTCLELQTTPELVTRRAAPPLQPEDISL